MSKFAELKYKYGLYRLRKDFRKPEDNAIACNLKKAKSIGIIYNATKQEDFIIVKDFVYKLKEIVPNVQAMGFVNTKELSDFHIQPLEFSFFCNSNLNWYYKPHENSVDEFVKQKFDILIDLNLKELLAVRFVLAESTALFKTGRFCNIEPNYYDLMIKLPKKNKNQEEEEQQADINPLKLLIQQTEHYLQMINPE
ncbi:MAG: hypothetical protein PHW82_11095 [Bacteroidales bacterium]|nr:hypothetical protein [Bacteroidales bacterium]